MKVISYNVDLREVIGMIIVDPADNKGWLIADAKWDGARTSPVLELVEHVAEPAQ